MSSAPIRRARQSDVEQLALLSESVGFNQSVNDWRRFQSASDAGCFVIEEDGRIAATSIGFAFGGRCGWIGMVIVDPAFRRRGLGETMTVAAIEYLEGKGSEYIGLDARDAGEAIYERLGFESSYPLHRWELRGRITPDPLVPSGMRDIRANDFPVVCELDSRAFGADRSPILRTFLEARDVRGAVVEHDGEIVAFGLARLGVGPLAIGPILTGDNGTAGHLIAHLMTRADASAAVINVLPSDEISAELKRFGFKHVLDFKRMYRGGWPQPELQHAYCAALGPELG